MKHLLDPAFPLILLLAATPLMAQQPLSAAQWAVQQKDALSTITETSLADTLKHGAPALEKLLAEVKTGGVSDPVALTRIAALTQYVMRPQAPQRARPTPTRS